MADLIPTATEAEWLEARRSRITASEMAVVMGLSPWDSPYALYHRKLGILPAIEDNPAMERGRVLEPYIAEKFAAAHPEFTVMGFGRELYAHPERDWEAATPDRLLYAKDANGYFDLEEPVAVLECKTASDMSEWGEPGTDEIPVVYRCQVLVQMDVMGVDTAYVAVLDVPRWEVREYVVTHDDSPVIEYPHDIPGPLAPGICRACGDLELMHQAARDFLGRIDRQEPPAVDWRPATIGALKQLHPSLTDETAEIGPQLADRYEAAARNARKWEQRKRLYEAQIREKAGSAHRIVRMGPGQVPVARRDVYEVREHVRKASTTDKLVLTPPKPKKES